MKSREITNLLLKEVAAQIDAKDDASKIELDDSGICAFTYQGHLEVIFELIESQHALVVYTPLLKVGHAPDPHQLQRCMQWNFLGQETKGGFFAFNQHDESIYFQNYFNLAYVTVGGFLEGFGEFLKNLTHFQSELDKEASSVPAKVHEVHDLQHFMRYHA